MDIMGQTGALLRIAPDELSSKTAPVFEVQETLDPLA
jgi:hypothetical protein